MIYVVILPWVIRMQVLTYWHIMWLLRGWVCASDEDCEREGQVERLNLSGCKVTDPIDKHSLTELKKNTSLVTLDIGSAKLSGSCTVSLFQQMTTHPTLSISVGEVNVLGVGRVKADRGTMWCVMGDVIPDKCVEFFRALNNSVLRSQIWEYMISQTKQLSNLLLD